MNEINLYLLDMSYENNTSGVDRYIGSLLAGLENFPFIHVYRILFLSGNILFHKEEKRKNYTQAVIPMPQQSDEIIGERYWFQKYNEQFFPLVKHLFENKPNRIIHIHTLNLIAPALYINSQIPCKIITHLHCIPWKDFYNKNPKKFNQLYASYYLDDAQLPDKQRFLTNNCESDSYTIPDKIICVTHCAKDFLKKAMEIPEENIAVVSNGINDMENDTAGKASKKRSDTFQCLFVGTLSEGKGIFYILKALRKVQAQGFSVCLNMAGMCNSSVRKQIKEEYGDLQVNVLGRIPFEELQSLYRESDIGIIASLQEQCSYAAIEMAMFGLPVIATAVDGLDEIFTDGVNALKVNTRFSKVFGLSVDTDMLADKIIALIENDRLREQLGINVRKLYLEKFTLERMAQQTIHVYKETINGKIKQ
ncbi:MAG: glycosyltransferase family 4 protein [Dysgonamonadaceae bacterium]|nr:glycosyltransferase family 4 protein [Dysgonamonadaceae bacterium]